MDDRLQELFYRVQQTAVDLGNTAADMAATAVRGAANLVQMGRQRTALIDLKAEVNLQLREIGELVYGTHTGKPTDSDILFAKLARIDALKAEIARIEAGAPARSFVDAEFRGAAEESADAADFADETDFADEPQGPVCAACGGENRPGDRFCRHCGEKLN